MIVNKGSFKYFAIDSTNLTVLNDNTAINFENEFSSRVSESKTLQKNNCQFNSSFQTNSQANNVIYKNEAIVKLDNFNLESNNCFRNNCHLGNTFGNQVSDFTDNSYSIKNVENFNLNNSDQNFQKLENEKRFLNKENYFDKNELNSDDINHEFDQLDLSLFSNQIFDFNIENNDFNNFEDNIDNRNDLSRFLS